MTSVKGGPDLPMQANGGTAHFWSGLTMPYASTWVALTACLGGAGGLLCACGRAFGIEGLFPTIATLRGGCGSSGVKGLYCKLPKMCLAKSAGAVSTARERGCALKRLFVYPCTVSAVHSSAMSSGDLLVALRSVLGGNMCAWGEGGGPQFCGRERNAVLLPTTASIFQMHS